MESKALIPELKEVAAGDHLCHLYSSRKEKREVISAYLRDGLERGERVVYVGGKGCRGEIEEGLAELGLKVSGFLASGQLSFVSQREAYTPDGTFDPGLTLAFWAREAERASGEGWAALRGAGEMSWALAGPPGWRRLIEYEAEVNRFPAARACVMLCQYDRDAFDPEVQLDLLRTHPLVLFDGNLYDNVYYVNPGEFFANMVPQSVLRYHLGHLKERRRSQAEIQAAREYAEAIVDKVREPLLVLDADLRVITANRSFYRTFRVSRQETEGRPVYELGERQWDIRELRRLLEDVIPLNTFFQDYEVEADFPHIGRRYMLLNARRIYREGHRTEMVLLAIEDVTERRLTEEELRRRESYYHRLVEHAFDAVTVLDAEGRHVYASPSVSTVLGWEPEELLGRTAFEFMHPDEIADVLEVFQRGLADPGSSHRLVHRFKGRDGTWRYIESAGTNLMDDDCVKGVVINCRDITASKLAGERLQKMNRMFLALGADFLANMELAIKTCRDILGADLAAYARPKGGKLSLLTTSSGEEGLVFYDHPSGFTGWPLLNGSVRGYMSVDVEKAARKGEEDPLVKRHGYASFLGYPVLGRGAPVGVLCVYSRDRLKAGEHDLETLATFARTLEIEEERLAREEGLKDFIDISSHELRHPVAIIKGFTLTLKEHWKELSEDRLLEIFAAIDTTSDRLTRLMEGLLDTSRIERGRFRLDLRETELLPLVRQAVREMNGPSVRLALRSEGVFETCLLDPDRFLDVLIILLENALKFSPPDRAVEVEAESRDDYYLISVLDRGAGIPEEEREQIFDRFYQVEKARFHSQPGMGLGLYIAREIVERHHGKIWCEPREGGGSVFRFTIPK